jgi:hypothetical protein
MFGKPIFPPEISGGRYKGEEDNALGIDQGGYESHLKAFVIFNRRTFTINGSMVPSEIKR